MRLTFLRSVRLALILIAILTLGCVLATLVPQGREADWYRDRYPWPLSVLILALGLPGFFRSAAFLVPAALLTVNLALCTAHRVRSRWRTGARRRHGPDLIHAGLLLLVVGGAVTLFGRSERLLYLGEGHTIVLPGGAELRVRSVEQLLYPDGRPRDWVTTVEVLDSETRREAGIEVNRPLRVGRLKVYQYSYHRLPALVLEQGGTRLTLLPGQELQTTAGPFRYRSFEEDRQAVLFVSPQPNGTARELWVALGEVLAGHRLDAVQPFPVTGLHLVRDPGYLPVMIALVLIAVGLTLTFIQKAFEEKAQ